MRLSHTLSNRVEETMLKKQAIDIKTIYVPAKRRQTLDPKKVDALAESILSDGQETPILVRPDGTRFVLVEGLHRLEACKALGETTVTAYLVQAGSIDVVHLRVLKERPVVLELKHE
jgi:sulfiredoxin